MTQQIEALNIAGQCRATASSPLAKNILVDEGNGLLTELLLDAARIIEALAQPEQEPVACIGTNGELMWLNKPKVIYSKPQPLYTAPPQQEPVIDKSAAIRIATSLGWTSQRKPLTDEEISEIAINNPPVVHEFARAIEAAHGIKENT
jgi:hypothetical protein